MKVLIVTNVFPSDKHPYHGIFVAEQIKAIKELYSDIEFDVSYIDGFSGKLQYLKSIWNVSKKINQGNYDLIHIHYGLAGLYLYWPFLKKTPTIVTFHGSDIQPRGGNGKISEIISIHAAKRANAAVVLNDKMERIVEPYCKNIYKIPCGVNLELFRPMERSEVHNKIQVVFPSSHDRKVKNYPLFCKVIKILNNKYGIAVEERELKNMNRLQIAQLYSNADVLLMTSNSEGSPQALKEAMACNLPCVSTPVGDVCELLHGVANSYVSKKHDAEELAELVAKSLRRDGVGINGRDKLKQMQLDEKSIAERIMDVYKQLLN